MSGRLARMALGALSTTDARPRWTSPYESAPVPIPGPEERAVGFRPQRPSEGEASDQLSSSPTEVLYDTVSPPGTMGSARGATIGRQELHEEYEEHEEQRITAAESTRAGLPASATPTRRDAKPMIHARPGRARELPERVPSSPSPMRHVTQGVTIANPAIPIRSSSSSAEEARPSQGRSSETLPARPVQPPSATSAQPMARVSPPTAEPAPRRQTGRAAGETAQRDPTVVVTIGRLEVRAMSPLPPTPRASSAPTPMSLDAYLTWRDQEKR